MSERASQPSSQNYGSVGEQYITLQEIDENEWNTNWESKIVECDLGPHLSWLQRPEQSDGSLERSIISHVWNKL